MTGLPILDLTRVLAGPVATRFLVGYGANVLHIDPPEWNEPGVEPARRPHWHVHFTPTSSSWINQVERWFTELTRKQLQRGVHVCVKDLESDIMKFMNCHNGNRSRINGSNPPTRSSPPLNVSAENRTDPMRRILDSGD